MPDYVNVTTMDRIPARIQRETTLALEVNPSITPFGCCHFFDDCSDEGLFTLFFNGQLDLLDWMGFEVSDVCHREIEFLNYVAPHDCNETGVVGACESPKGVEFGSCNLTIDDFGSYGRQGPVRRLDKPVRYCENSPMRFIDGSPVTSEMNWDEFFTMNQLLADVRKQLIVGNATNNANQMDGLEQIVTTGYSCEGLDSYVVDWNENTMAGGAGITLNGNATPAGYDIVDWLLDLTRNIRSRISWSPLLMNQQMRVGDMILVLPGFMARCLLDFFTCWSVCSGTQYEEANKSPSLEMRDYRLQLNGGLFGDGRIFLDGFEIPLLQYDWELIKGPTRGDMYLLTGSIGSMRVWEGQHLDMRNVTQQMTDFGLAGNPGGFYTRDDGRVLGKVVFDGTCRRIELRMRPRIFCKAPWAQIRFQNVVCRTPSGPLSPDPCESSFYIESPLTSASCP